MPKNFGVIIILVGVIILNAVFLEKELTVFLFREIYNQPTEILTANLSQNFGNSSRTISAGTVPELLKIPEFQAKSVIVLKIDQINQNGTENILYQKNIREKLPIASLTKLMTAVIAFENYGSISSPQVNPDEKILISKEAVSQESDRGNFKIGERISVKNLLYSMLIESSNDAAYALAENSGLEQFIEKMNLKSQELGMLNTNFYNSTGLDGDKNYSTSEDLVKLIKYIILNYPQILEITSKVSAEILNDDGSLHHLAINTNQLLGKIPGIIGGKTGYNEEAMGCLILVLKNSAGNYLINIILGSSDRFGEMQELVNWVNQL